MVGIGMLLGWAGYSLGLFGWTMIRGYDVTLGQLMSPLHPYGSGTGQPWPPAPMPGTQIWPGGTAAPPAPGTAGAGTPAIGPGSKFQAQGTVAR